MVVKDVWRTVKFIILILFDCLMDCLEITADAGTTKRAIVDEGEECEAAWLPAGPLFI